MQRQLDEIQCLLNQYTEECTRLITRQDRLRKNIESSSGSELVIRWQNELAKAEDEILAIEESKLPDAKRQENEVRHKLFDSMNQLSIARSQ